VNYRVLVVEDNAVNRELLCEWLETEGYEVTSVGELKAAFDALQSHPPHAVLLDIQLGAEDGAALAGWIRRQPTLREIPVIAVTAHAMANEQQRILLAGCNACISKPIDFKMLHDQLDGWLALSTKRSKATESGPDAREPEGK
jgi:two-component system, sensor histidine kinase and response regulator